MAQLSIWVVLGLIILAHYLSDIETTRKQDEIIKLINKKLKEGKETE